MRVGDPVKVIAPWNSFYGLRGIVTEMKPVLMVHLHSERLPMAFDARDVITEEESTPHMTAGE